MLLASSGNSFLSNFLELIQTQTTQLPVGWFRPSYQNTPSPRTRLSPRTEAWNEAASFLSSAPGQLFTGLTRPHPQARLFPHHQKLKHPGHCAPAPPPGRPHPRSPPCGMPRLRTGCLGPRPPRCPGLSLRWHLAPATPLRGSRSVPGYILSLGPLAAPAGSHPPPGFAESPGQAPAPPWGRSPTPARPPRSSSHRPGREGGPRQSHACPPS